LPKLFHSKKWEDIKQQFQSILEKQIVEAKAKPYTIALGCAIGIGFNFVPTFGLGFVVAFIIAWIFRVNRACAAGTSLLTGPFVPLMYALNFIVGGFFMTPAAGDMSIIEFIVDQYTKILHVGSLRDKIFGFLELFGSSFLLGATVNAAIFGTGVYFLAMRLMKNLSPQKRLDLNKPAE